MSDATYSVREERSLAAVVAEIKDEVKEFVQTRVALLTAELKSNMADLKAAIPLALIGLVLLGTAYLLLVLALVGLVAVAFLGNPYAWFFAFLIVGGFWLIVGGLMAYMAYSKLRKSSLMPRKTVETLKADKQWLENEARSHA